MSSARWYAWIDGAAQGPFEPSELAGRGADILVCREGADSWVAAKDVPELAAVVAGSTAPEGGASARYYTYIAGQTQGPFTVDHLKPFLQPGLLVCREGSDSWVAAKDVPELAAETPSTSTLAMPPLLGAAPGSAANRLSLLAAPSPLSGSPSPDLRSVGGTAPLPAPMPARSAAAAPEAAPRDLPPLLKELWLICRNASDELLLEQKKKHWKRFFKNEQEIIGAEIARRGLKV